MQLLSHAIKGEGRPGKTITVMCLDVCLFSDLPCLTFYKNGERIILALKIKQCDEQHSVQN